MSDQFSRIARRLIDESLHGQELTELGAWLVAGRYAPFVVEQHLRRMDYILGRLPKGTPPGVYTTAQLDAVFGAECSPLSRRYRFAGTHRVYQRFLLAFDRLRAPQPADRFAGLRGQYGQYLIDIRGLSTSSRQHHAQTVADFLERALRRDQPLRTVTRGDIERFILLRSQEVSRHSLQHTVAHIRAFLRYAHNTGEVPVRLDSLDTPRTYRGELPPQAVPWPMVKTLLASIDRHSKRAGGTRASCTWRRITVCGHRRSCRFAWIRSIGMHRSCTSTSRRRDQNSSCRSARQHFASFESICSMIRPGARSTTRRCFTAHAARTGLWSDSLSTTSCRSDRARRDCRRSAVVPIA